MQKFFDNVVDKNGHVLAGASVTVTDAATGALSTIYSDNSFGIKANPITCDSNGYFEFYAANGRYNIDVTGAGLQTRHVTDVLLEDITGTGADLIGFLQSGTGVVSRSSQDKMRERISAADFGISSGNTGAVNTALLQGAIDYYSGLTRQVVISFRTLTGTVRFAKQSGQTYCVKLKRGICLDGEISGQPDTNGVTLMLDDGQNCDLFVIDGGSSAQHYGIRGVLLDGNKANNPTGGHLIRALSLDFANCVEWLKLQNAKGAGLYLDNTTYVNAGNVRLSNIDAVRCDGAGLYLFGAADTILLENIMCEGNGLDGTGGSAGANYVFENGTDSTLILMLSCRAEARTLANGGAVYNVLLKNMSGGTLRLNAGFLQGVSGNIRAADIAITTSTARVVIQAGRVQSTTGAPTVVIDDQFAGRQVLRADIDFRNRGLKYNCQEMVIPDTGSGVLETFGDKTSNYGTRTASTAAAEGSISARAGSTHHRTDQSGNGSLYVKRKEAVAGTADTANWWEMRGFRGQTLTFAASVTPAISDGNEMTVTLTGNISLGVVTGAVEGNEMSVLFIQDATGGRTVTWNAAYKGTTSGTSGTAGQQLLVCFKRRNGAWVQVSSTGWY